MLYTKRFIIFNLVAVSITVAFILGFSACKRSADNQEFLGSDVRPAPEGFAVSGNAFTAAPVVADFTMDVVQFSSVFSHEVSWTIQIKGLISGAVKEIRGTSDNLNASNATWNGNSSNIYFFRTGEKCIAELSFMGSTLVLRDTVSVLWAKDYNGQSGNGVKYTLIDDFDGSGVSISAVSKDAFDQSVTMSADTMNKIQGKKSFKMSGLDFNKNSWSGGIGHNTLVEMKTAGKTPVTTDPSKVYINLYVYGSGKANSAIQIKMYEVDDESNLAKIPFPGYTYLQNKNDAWVMDVQVTWTGWRLVSKKYSNFITAKDPAAGGGGNKTLEPHKITGMGISLLSLPDPGASTEVSVDYVVISEGGVFIP